MSVHVTADGDGSDLGGEPACTAHLHEDGTTFGDAVVTVDSAGVITVWSSGATDLFGWSSDEAVGQSLELIIPERLRERHTTGFTAVMATGRSRYGAADVLRVPALCRDGSTVRVAFTISVIPGPGGLPSGVQAVLREDDERRQPRG